MLVLQHEQLDSSSPSKHPSFFSINTSDNHVQWRTRIIDANTEEEAVVVVADDSTSESAEVCSAPEMRIASRTARNAAVLEHQWRSSYSKMAYDKEKEGASISKIHHH